jgi:hypothetical protein
VWTGPVTPDSAPLNTTGAGAAQPEVAVEALTAGQVVYVSVHRYLIADGDDGAYTLTAVLE